MSDGKTTTENNESQSNSNSDSDGKAAFQSMASFSMSYALSIARRRIEERQKAKDLEEKNLEEERKEKARAKSKRRRQNQKLAKARARELASQNPVPEATKEEQKSNEETINCDDKSSLKRDNSDSDLIVRTPAKKRLKFGSPERIDHEIGGHGNQVEQKTSKKIQFIPRALLLKKS